MWKNFVLWPRVCCCWKKSLKSAKTLVYFQISHKVVRARTMSTNWMTNSNTFGQDQEYCKSLRENNPAFFTKEWKLLSFSCSVWLREEREKSQFHGSQALLWKMRWILKALSCVLPPLTKSLGAPGAPFWSFFSLLHSYGLPSNHKRPGFWSKPRAAQVFFSTTLSWGSENLRYNVFFSLFLSSWERKFNVKTHSGL